MTHRLLGRGPGGVLPQPRPRAALARARSVGRDRQAGHPAHCRLARAVVVPDAIPPDRLARYGAGPAKLRPYPGLKEEYYLADFEPDPAVLAEPWTLPARTLKLTDVELEESARCEDRSLAYMKDLTSHDNPR